MDLTNAPENIINISASSLDLELCSKVDINLVQSLTIRNLVKKRCFGKWLRVIQIQVSLNVTSGISLYGSIFKNSKPTNQIDIVLETFRTNSLLIIFSFVIYF